LVSSADRDSDGSVSFGEFSTVVYESIARRVDKRLQQLDRNRDGRCTRAEVKKMTAARFARFDLNRDGAFTAAELAIVMQREVAGRLERLYVRLDVNRDGRFSLAELTPAPKPEATKVAALKPTRRYVVAKRGPTNVQ
jgi:Ca2+-binding EF-hand superfamily protein